MTEERPHKNCAPETAAMNAETVLADSLHSRIPLRSKPAVASTNPQSNQENIYVLRR
jgi:hypothetical protein